MEKISHEQLFQELVLNKIDINNPVTDNQRFPWLIFWLGINGEYVCEWDYESEWLLFHYSTIWSVFENELNLKFAEIQEIMRVKVEEHFGLKGVTPVASPFFWPMNVEEHFQNTRILT